MDQTYKLSGMHCGSCIARVRAALSPFADRVDVTLTPQRATLVNARQSDLAALNAAVARAGAYTIEPLGAPAPINATGAPGFSATPASYYPLYLIAAYIAVAALAGTFGTDGFNGQAWMANFMAGFFLVFSAFKFLNLDGFADAYASYDLLAKRWRGWGYVYPFLELALGLAYLLRVAPTLTHIATIILMGFSSLGVIEALRNRRQIACACLGTVLKLPMSTITLVEDLAMVAMAAFMLLAGGHN
jgi:copper chaperone CopZ